MVGELLERFTTIAYGCAAVVLLTLVARAVLGPRPRRFAYRLGGLLLMIAATVYAGAVIAPRIAAMQRSMGTAPSALAEGDPLPPVHMPWPAAAAGDGVWRRLVARPLWERKVAGSNPVTPTFARRPSGGVAGRRRRPGRVDGLVLERCP